jgi:hypothetical protein
MTIGLWQRGHGLPDRHPRFSTANRVKWGSAVDRVVPSLPGTLFGPSWEEHAEQARHYKENE